MKSTCFPDGKLQFSAYIGAPTIDTLSSISITISAGSPLTLNCTSRGSPPDIFTWRKDNSTEKPSTSMIAVNHTSASAVFRAYYSIGNVTMSDSGSYTCTVSNPIGNDSATIMVIVEGTCICIYASSIYEHQHTVNNYSII